MREMKERSVWKREGRHTARTCIAAGAVVAVVLAMAPTAAAASRGALNRMVALSVAHAPGAGAIASARAVETGSPVVVEAMTTPTTLTTALPDGTMQLEQDTVPVRVRKDGGWVPVNTDLEQNGDWFSPVASAVPVRFSPGGNNVISETQTVSGDWVSELWSGGRLPAPQIEGDTATYPEVTPDVDLKLVATRTGMASIYVVKSEQAAKASGLSQLRVEVDGAELTSPDDGRIRAKADDGSALLAAQPLWWDSSAGGTYRNAGERAVPVEHVIAPDQLTMDVGQSVRKAEARSAGEIEYPIFVDPDWSAGVPAAWYTDAAYPDASYLTEGASDVLRVGVFGPYRSDLFFQFAIGSMLSKHVLKAVLNTTQLAVKACPLSGAIEARLYGLWPAGFTWNQEQGWNNAGNGGWSDVMDTWMGPQSCGESPVPVGWTVTAGVQQRLNEGASGIEIALVPSDPWAPSRRWFSRSATLIITYNTIPNVPTAPAFTSPVRTCGTSANPVSVSNVGPIAVKVDVTDPDPDNTSAYFVAISMANPSVALWSYRTATAAQGSHGAVIPAGSLPDGYYAWDARSFDSTGDWSNWFGRCYFYADSTKPPLPGVSTTSTAFTVGKAVDVKLAGAADVAGYVYWVTPSRLAPTAPEIPVDGVVSTAVALPDCNGRVTAKVRWACGNGTAPVTVTVAPTDSLSTLWVSAYDKAGNQSEARGLPLYTSIGTPAASANVDAGHAWQVTNMSSPLPSVVPDSNPWIGANGIDLHLPSGASVASTDTVVPPLPGPVMMTGPLPFAADEITALKAPVNAANSFTWSMWIKTGSIPNLGQDQVVAMQARGGGRGEVRLLATQGGQYSFCITGAVAPDDNGRPVSSCATGGSLAVGSWQLVTGIWDAKNQQLRLLIGRSIEPVAVAGHVLGSGDWSASGPLVFGPSPDTYRFCGYIANPAILPGVIDHDQLARLADLYLPFSE